MEVQNVTRIRDQFLDFQYRDQNTALGRWDTKEKILAQIEEIFNEPSDSSLQSLMDQLWSSWQVVASNPESMAARESLNQRALALVEAFKQGDKSLSDLQWNLDSAVKIKVKEINLLGEQIVSLNERIAYSTGVGLEANDLEDQRDLLIDQLSKITGITVLEGDNRSVRILISGITLIDGSRLNRLETEVDPLNQGFLKIGWEEFGSPPDIQGGELGAYLELRDTTLNKYRDQLKTLAWNIATETNNLHRTGYDLNGVAVAGNAWEDYFTVDPVLANFDIQTLDVNNSIIQDPRRIAVATQSGHPGDGSNALNIAGVKRTVLAGLGNFTPDDYYRSLIGTLGVESREAKQLKESQDLVVQKISNQRQSISGVNLDEEMMDLVRFQHAFNAAARLVTMLDENMSTIINRMGAR